MSPKNGKRFLCARREAVDFNFDMFASHCDTWSCPGNAQFGKLSHSPIVLNDLDKHFSDFCCPYLQSEDYDDEVSFGHCGYMNDSCCTHLLIAKIVSYILKSKLRQLMCVEI